MAKEHILVVDDEEDILELVRYNLVKEGYRVTTVASGEEALKSARSAQPDIILLDLMLPGVDGLEVCRLLKQDSKTQHVPIIMLSAKGEEADIVTGLELGAADYIAQTLQPKGPRWLACGRCSVAALQKLFLKVLLSLFTR